MATAARVGAEIGKAEKGGIVAGLAHLTRDIGMTVIQRRPVRHRAMIMQIESRVETGARRPTGCRLRVVAAKQGAFGRQRVQIRRVHDRMAEGREAFTPPLIRSNEKHVFRRLAHTNPRVPDGSRMSPTLVAY